MNFIKALYVLLLYGGPQLIFLSVVFVLSYASKKIWEKPRVTAALKNVSDQVFPESVNSKDNLPICNTIRLEGDRYQVEFGCQEKLYDGITLRAVIEDSKLNGMKDVFKHIKSDGVWLVFKPDIIRAKVFLSGNQFMIAANNSTGTASEAEQVELRSQSSASANNSTDTAEVSIIKRHPNSNNLNSDVLTYYEKDEQPCNRDLALSPYDLIRIKNKKKAFLFLFNVNDDIIHKNYTINIY